MTQDEYKLLHEALEYAMEEATRLRMETEATYNAYYKPHRVIAARRDCEMVHRAIVCLEGLEP